MGIEMGLVPVDSVKRVWDDYMYYSIRFGTGSYNFIVN